MFLIVKFYKLSSLGMDILEPIKTLASFLWDIGRQWKTRSDAAECSVWSGFLLFAFKMYF